MVGKQNLEIRIKGDGDSPQAYYGKRTCLFIDNKVK